MSSTEDAAAMVETGRRMNETVETFMQDLHQKGLDSVAAVEAAYIDRLNTLRVDVFVNQENGDDANEGSVDLPLKSIQAALDMTPRSGYCVVRLTGHYHIDANIRLEQKRLLLKSSNSQKHYLTYERFKLDYNNNQYRSGFGFISAGGPSIVIDGLTVVVPGSDGLFGTYLKNQQGCLFSQADFNENEAYKVMLMNCAISIPSDPYAPLFANTYNNLTLTVFNCSLIGLPLEGNILWGYDDRSGTDAGSIPILSTNLPQI